MFPADSLRWAMWLFLVRKSVSSALVAVVGDAELVADLQRSELMICCDSGNLLSVKGNAVGDGPADLDGRLFGQS